MRTAMQIVVLMVLVLAGVGIVTLVNAPKWFDSRPAATQPAATLPATPSGA